MATSMSPGKTNLSQTLSFEKRNILRDPSFSSYLSSSDENFIVKLTESTRKPSPPTMSPLGHGLVHRVYAGRVNDIEDEEIGVFGAEKYFQGELEEKSTRKVCKDFSTKTLHQNESSQVKVKVKSTDSSRELGTRSVCSESSVNSRSVLLSKVPRNRASSKGSYLKNFFASLACNCHDGAAVEVDKQSVEKGDEMTKPPLITAVDLVQETKSTPWTKDEMHINLMKEDCFSFPVLSLQEGEKDKDQMNPLNLERKISMLSNWDDVVVPREEKSSYGMYNNDAASDASSDLFELESFSTNGMSSCMTPITCYAPSEASIEWSVVTASAADCYESSVNGKPNNLDRMVRNARIGSRTGKDREKKRAGILSGCTSDKSVKIVENECLSAAGEAAAAGSGYRRNPMTSETRFRGETRYDSAGGFRHCSLPRSHSPRVLYIQ